MGVVLIGPHYPTPPESSAWPSRMMRPTSFFKRQGSSPASPPESPSSALNEKISRLEEERRSIFEASEERKQAEFELAEESRAVGAAARENGFRTLLEDIRSRFEAASDRQHLVFDVAHVRRAQVVRDTAELRHREFSEQERRHDTNFELQLRTFAEEAKWYADLRSKLAEEAHAARTQECDELKVALARGLSQTPHTQDQKADVANSDSPYVVPQNAEMREVFWREGNAQMAGKDSNTPVTESTKIQPDTCDYVGSQSIPCIRTAELRLINIPRPADAQLPALLSSDPRPSVDPAVEIAAAKPESPVSIQTFPSVVPDLRSRTSTPPGSLHIENMVETHGPADADEEDPSATQGEGPTAVPSSEPQYDIYSPPHIIPVVVAPPRPHRDSGFKRKTAQDLLHGAEARLDALTEDTEAERDAIYQAAEAQRDDAIDQMASRFIVVGQELDAAFQKAISERENLENSLWQLIEGNEDTRRQGFEDETRHRDQTFEAFLRRERRRIATEIAVADRRVEELRVEVENLSRKKAGTKQDPLPSNTPDIHEARRRPVSNASNPSPSLCGSSIILSEDGVALMRHPRLISSIGEKTAVLGVITPSPAPRRQRGGPHNMSGLGADVLLNFSAKLNSPLPVVQPMSQTARIRPKSVSGQVESAEEGLLEYLSQWCKERQAKRDQSSANASERREQEFDRKERKRAQRFENDQRDRAARAAESSRECTTKFAEAQLSLEAQFLKREKNSSAVFAAAQQSRTRIFTSECDVREWKVGKVMGELMKDWTESEAVRAASFRAWALVVKKAVEETGSFVE